MSDFSLGDEINLAFRCGQHPLNTHREGVASLITAALAAAATAITAAATTALVAAAAAAAAVAAAAFAAARHLKPQKHGYPSPLFRGGTTRT